jgi:N-acetylneuraminic acid mutarotase
MIIGSTAIAARSPGDRPDLLYRVEEGAYYGHPNPSRGECIFFGGNPTEALDFSVPTTSETSATDYMDTDKYVVGVQPMPGWREPLFSFGRNKSANGIIEYASDVFCGRLKGDLLVTYFAQSDQIRRLQLSPEGLNVRFDKPLIRSSATTGGTLLGNPLPLVQDPNGRIYVGEYGQNHITVFEPIRAGIWRTSGPASMPTPLLDAGGAVLNNKLYAVGGKTSSGHQDTLYSYAPEVNRWSTLSALPSDYPAVENPAIVAYAGRLYVFGGSTDPFSGAVSKAAVYDPQSDSWHMLPPMPTARGGATAQVIEDDLYVVGGMDTNGDSTAGVEIFNAATNTWHSGPPMSTPRDNLGSAVVNNKLYVFGGRIRRDDTEVMGTLNSAEIYEPGSGWTPAAPMPTGRRAMNVVTYNGEIIVMGGEKTPAGDTFVANEAYHPASNSWRIQTDMPVGRHGAIAGLIDGVIFVAGGGTTGGTSFTSDVDTLHLECDLDKVSNHIYLPAVQAILSNDGP